LRKSDPFSWKTAIMSAGEGADTQNHAENDLLLHKKRLRQAAALENA